jgi:anaerobic magnesium-protoporphyrin IX monomethyl ester cyclase
MRVLLVSPTFKEMYKELKSVATDYPPLGLAYLGAVLEKEGCEVKIIDMSVLRVTPERLLAIIERFCPELIGISLTTPLAETVYRLVARIKANFDIPVILGGAHPTSNPAECLEKGADIVVRGEGEETIAELIHKLDRLEVVKGISYKKDGKFFHNDARPPIQDLDRLPFPARHLLPLKKYDFVDAKNKPVGTIMTSRGCPFGCVYCNKNIFGLKFRARSPENVLSEIEEMVRKYNVREIHIEDDVFSLNKERAMKIFDGIIQKRLRVTILIGNGVRVDSVDFELLKKMKQAGLYSISFGVESGSQEILDGICKGIKLDQARRAFKMSKKLGLETWGFFMLGLPGDTKKTMQMTIDFAKELDPDVAKFFITIPLPGTKLYNKLLEEGRMRVKGWSDFNFYEKPIFAHENLDSETIVAYHKKAFREFYFRPKKILQEIWRAKSPKRLFSYAQAGWGLFKKSFS